MKELLEQICANPEDDAPRLVYADLLVERGDPRGELIQIQCELAAWQGERTERHAALHARERELLAAHLDEWQAPTLQYGIRTHLERGFPHTLYVTADKFFAARHLLATLPIRGLSFLGDLTPRFAELVEAPELAQLTYLDLGRPSSRGFARAFKLGDARFATLVREANLSSLRRLLAGSHDLGPIGCAALAHAPWLPQLTRLSLRTNPLFSEGVALLAPRLGKLESLDLHDTQLDDVALHALAAAPTSSPGSLILSGHWSEVPHRFSAAGIAALDRAGILRDVSHLLLDSAQLGDEGIRALAEATSMQRLEQLGLSGNDFADDGALALARSPRLARVTWLELRNNRIGPAGAEAFATSTSLASVEMLLLERNRLGHAGVAALAAATGLPSLTTLGISRNELLVPGADGELETEDDAITSARFAARPQWRIL